MTRLDDPAVKPSLRARCVVAEEECKWCHGTGWAAFNATGCIECTHCDGCGRQYFTTSTGGTIKP